MNRTDKTLALVLGLFALAAPLAAQVVLPEVEPNTNKAEALARGIFAIGSGDAITGTATGSVIAPPSSQSFTVDMFHVQTAPLPLGIYRHAVAITTTGTAGHTGNIRGLSQTGGAVNPGTDDVVQTTASFGGLPRTNAWYGFGKGEQVYYRVAGTSSTTSPYLSTLTTTAVMPMDLGSFIAGSITISTIGLTTQDTEIWVYDSNLDLVPGFSNDNPLSGGTQAELTRTFSPGTYYVAVGRDLATSAPDPADSTGSGGVLDFPNGIVSGAYITNADFDFRVNDCSRTLFVPATSSSHYGIVWSTFHVGSSMSLTITQPGGPGTGMVITNQGGTPGNVYLNAMTPNVGLFPNGWFFGVDIPFEHLALELAAGQPFIGQLDAQGGMTFTMPFVLPVGFQVWAVGVELEAGTFLPKSGCYQPFTAVSQ